MASVRKRTWTHNEPAKETWVCEYTDAAGKGRLKTFAKKRMPIASGVKSRLMSAWANIRPMQPAFA